MVVLTATYTVDPHEMEGVLADLQEMVLRVHAQEPGCTMYQVHQSVEDPRKILLYEVYQDQQSFDAHVATGHFREIVLGRIVPKLLHRERQLWRALDWT